MAEQMIEVRDLIKHYRGGQRSALALRSVSFAIERGEFVAIVGRSGSGKTTLMNVLGCLDAPTSGDYLLDGRPVARLGADALADVRADKLGFVFQQYNLLPRLTAARNVELPLIYRGVGPAERRARALDALGAVGLVSKGDSLPGRLSGGEQQRVAIARALVGRPSVLLADEPTGALDSETSAALIGLLHRLNAERLLTVVLVTHDPEVAARAHRVLRLHDGRLVADSGRQARMTGGER